MLAKLAGSFTKAKTFPFHKTFAKVFLVRSITELSLNT